MSYLIQSALPRRAVIARGLTALGLRIGGLAHAEEFIRSAVTAGPHAQIAEVAKR